jgi:hypothetical protein
MESFREQAFKHLQLQDEEGSSCLFVSFLAELFESVRQYQLFNDRCRHLSIIFLITFLYIERPDKNKWHNLLRILVLGDSPGGP